MRVAIVGAGIVGVSTALWLARAGAAVVLIDRKPPGEGTSHGNAGVLASPSVVPVTTPGLIAKAPKMLFDPEQPLFLRWPYLPRLAPWLVKYLRHANAEDTARIAEALSLIVSNSLEDHQALAADTSAARFIVPSDYTFAYADRAHFEADGFGWGLRAKHGFTWDTYENDEVSAYEPSLGPNVKFLVAVRNCGHITDPGRYVKALADAAAAAGASVVTGTVTGLTLDGDRVRGVQLDGEEHAADHVVLATGVWSGPLADQLGLTVPLETERGYHLELINAEPMPQRPVMVAAGKFVATPMEGRLRLAGIVEFGGLKADPSDAPFALLKKAISHAMPSLTYRDEVRWMGHRPALPDSIPAIGEMPGIAGAWLGFGHHHIGLTAGPRTGRLLADLITGRRPNVDLSAFSPARFVSASRQKFKETVG